MLKKLKIIFIIIVLSKTVLIAQTTPHQMVSNMGVGINLGNILSAPVEGNWAPALTEEYVDNVARLGFKTVRIPIRFDTQTTPFTSVIYTGTGGSYIGSPSQYSVNATYLNRINQILGWCTSRGLVAIIDVHGDHWFWGSFNPSNTEYKTGNDRLAAIDRFKAIWRDISTTFQSQPEKVLFEIMNEAYFDMSATEVDTINTQILAIIRQTNPTRNVIVNGGGINSWEAPMAIGNTFLQSDTHLIATFHYYLPFKFTSSSSQSSPVFSWGSATDKNNVDNHFNQVQNWSVLKNIPVYVGEYGADNTNGMNYSTGVTTVGPDNNSRIAYHQYISQAAKNRSFSNTVWDAGDQSGKTIYIQANGGSWVKDVRNAVLGSTSTNQTLINNADIGLNYDYNWTITGTNAKLNNALPTDNYNGPTLNLKNNTAGSFNGVLLANDTFSTGFTAGQTYTIKFYAKGDANQQVRVRMKKISTSNVTTNPVLTTVTLSNTYTQYTTTYTVDADTQSLQLQLLCGLNTGNYFFDNFEVSNVTLSTENAISKENLLIYPNPTKDFFEINSKKTIDKVEIYSLDGKLLKTEKLKSKINISDLKFGLFLVKIYSNNSVKTQKLIIQ